MTKELIGCCGLDCEKCDARLATLNNDDELRRKTAELWSKLNSADITPEMINCTGCRPDGVKTPFLRLHLPYPQVRKRQGTCHLRRLQGCVRVRNSRHDKGKQPRCNEESDRAIKWAVKLIEQDMPPHEKFLSSKRQKHRT